MGKYLKVPQSCVGLVMMMIIMIQWLFTCWKWKNVCPFDLLLFFLGGLVLYFPLFSRFFTAEMQLFSSSTRFVDEVVSPLLSLNDLGATLAVLSGDIYRCLTMIIVTFFFLSLSLFSSSLVLSCCYSNKTYISTAVWFHVSLCCRARWSWNESRNGNCAAFNFTTASISASHFREKVAVEDTSCTWVAFACLKYLRTNPLFFFS